MPYKSLYKLKNFGIILIQNNFEDISMSEENKIIDPNMNLIKIISIIKY